MAALPTDLLQRVFPTRQLFRGPALAALILCVIGALVFCCLILNTSVVVALLNNQGRIVVAPDEIDEYQKLFREGPEPQASTGIDYAKEQAYLDKGLQAVAWEFRNRPWAGFLVALSHVRVVQHTNSALFYMIASVLILGLLNSAVMAYVRILAGRAADHSAGQLRQSLHRHALRMGTSDLKNEHSGDVLDLFTTDVETVRTGIQYWIETVFRAPLRLLALVVLACGIDWMVAYECVVPLIACWYLIRRERGHLRQAERLNADWASTELKLLAEGIRKSRLIRGYHLEEFEHGRFERHLTRYHDHLSLIDKQKLRAQWVARVLAVVAFALVLFLIGVRILALPTEPQFLTVAEGVMLLACFGLGWGPLEALADLRHTRTEAVVAADRIYRYLNTIPEVGQAVGARFMQPLDKQIEFESVTYKLGQRKLLDDLVLKIPAGGSTAIVAFDPLEARALVSLLPRFVEPHEGRVKVDGEDLAWVTLESLRTETLFVGGSEPWFTGTALENLTGGESRYSLTQVTEAAKKAHAHSFIQKYPQGYETVIGEHGEQPDASQGFRLALARALLRDPALLIVEEPTGNMSEDDKLLMEDACRRAVEDRTMIILPSRLSTLRSVDRIVLLNQGRVEVIGTHDVLLGSSALYRHWEYIHFNEFRHETANGSAARSSVS